MLKLLARPPNKTVLVAWSKKSWGPATDFADEIFKISVVSCIIVSKFSGAQSKCKCLWAINSKNSNSNIF
jgi:hypothetical protein